MKIKLICILIMIPFSFVGAQVKIKFHSINLAGIADGKSGAYWLLQTVNGLEYKNVFAGAGFGIDSYNTRTLPLFFDVRTSVATTNLFIFGDIGYNFPYQDKPGKEALYYNQYHFSGGLYDEIGIGYKMFLTRKTSLIFSTGYSYKKLKNEVGITEECFYPPCSVDYGKYIYGFGRILFKAGVLF